MVWAEAAEASDEACSRGSRTAEPYEAASEAEVLYAELEYFSLFFAPFFRFFHLVTPIPAVQPAAV